MFSGVEAAQVYVIKEEIVIRKIASMKVSLCTEYHLFPLPQSEILKRNHTLGFVWSFCMNCLILEGHDVEKYKVV